MRSFTSPVIAQYFFIDDEGSRTWAVKLQNNIPYDKLTRLYIAFAWIQDGRLTYKNTTNNPTDAERISALVKACRTANPLAEIYISSGFDDGSMYHTAAKNPDYFAQSVVGFLRSHSLDGYDLDWENGLNKEDLNKLLTATRAALDQASLADGKRYGLTLATWPSVQPEYDLATISQVVDAINIMSYGRDRALSSIVEEFINAGFPASKAIGGIETEVDYSEAGGPDTLGSGGTIAQKAASAMKRGMTGMMAWRLDNDYVRNNLSTYQGAKQLAQCMPVPIYLYIAQNPSRYYYTIDPIDSPGADWVLSKIPFFGFQQSTVGTVPVYQFSANSPQRYGFGTSPIPASGWTNNNKEAFYIMTSASQGAVPVYQYHQVLSDGCWNMFYSLDPNVTDWVKDDIAFYVFGD